MSSAELVGGFLVGASLTLVEYFRYWRPLRIRHLAVLEGFERGTRELECPTNKTPAVAERDKASVALLKMHIRSVALKNQAEAGLNEDVKKIQRGIRTWAAAADTAPLD